MEAGGLGKLDGDKLEGGVFCGWFGSTFSLLCSFSVGSRGQKTTTKPPNKRKKTEREEEGKRERNVVVDRS